MKRWRIDGFARRRSFAAALALLIVAIIAGRPSAGYAEQPSAVPASFSQQRLWRVGDYIRNEIATGKIPGAIMLIQQHGQPVYFENFGVRDVATQLPMTADTIFRLYSMSKPITSVAAMMLVEDGNLSLDDPVAKYIPAFADVIVGVEKRDQDGKPALVLEPLNRPITIEDLLRPHLGPHLWLLWRQCGEKALCGLRSVQGRFRQR
jgi:CubicO group peptidase (beta-lactamase class C family)